MINSILLKNGNIIDGTGRKGFPGHILIQGDTIHSILQDKDIPETDMVIDAGGNVICPGFIDMHSHSDWVLPRHDHDEAMQCLPEQGITTIIGGNCGFSPAPISERMRKLFDTVHFTLMNNRPLRYDWQTFGEYLERVEDADPIVNSAHQAGHASLRLGQADLQHRTLSDAELNKCLSELSRCFDEGACALSFGLGYEPGMYASLAELEKFCRAAASADKPVTVHMKALSRISPTYPPTYLKPHNIRALKEILRIARNTGGRLQLSHLIFVGRNSWPTADTCIRMIEKERANGLDVKFDAFPYTFGNTTINAFLPSWFLSKLPEGYRSWKDRFLLRLELQLGFFLVGFSFEDFQVMDAGVKKWEGLNGYRVTDIARQWNLSPFETVLRLSEESEGQTVVLFHTYSGEPGNEEVLENVLRHELCLFETDALTRYADYPNPAGLGTFPKILGEYVRNKKLFSMENAIQRMTSASAERFNIRNRGVLAAGKKADLVIFNPDSISETPARGPIPAGRPTGIQHVMINGIPVVKDGLYQAGVRAGRVLRG